MTCPYCDHQGEILNAVVRKTGEKIKICDECDTIWVENKFEYNLSDLDFEEFMRVRDIKPLWDELEFETK